MAVVFTDAGGLWNVESRGRDVHDRTSTVTPTQPIIVDPFSGCAFLLSLCSLLSLLRLHLTCGSLLIRVLLLRSLLRLQLLLLPRFVLGDFLAPLVRTNVHLNGNIDTIVRQDSSVKLRESLAERLNAVVALLQDPLREFELSLGVDLPVTQLVGAQLSHRIHGLLDREVEKVGEQEPVWKVYDAADAVEA